MGIYVYGVVAASVGFLVGHPKGHRLAGTILGPAVAFLSSLLGGKSAAAGRKQLPRTLATEKTTHEPSGAEPSTSVMEDMLKELSLTGKRVLDDMSDAQRASVLRECIPTIMAAGPGLVQDTIRFKGSYEAGTGEETLAWGATSATANQLAATFEARASGREPSPVSVDKHVSGRKVVTVFPKGFYECGLFPGYNGELWFAPGVEPEREQPTENKARLMFLLGAGNQATVVGGDILNSIFRENAVVLCKLNPINDYLMPHLQKAFAPLIKAGLLKLIYGGKSVSEFLINHSLVDILHMTGSDQTYDAIMWGPGAKKEGKPKISKQFTSELGCCTPYIITPGSWSDDAIELHTRQIVALCVHNGHFNCLAAQLIVTDAKWPQRQQFVDSLGRHLKAAQPRTPYYPGAEARHAKFLEEYKGNIAAIGEKVEGTLPWTLITDAEAKAQGHTCCTEAFSGVLTEVPLQSDGSPESFLATATKFCNDSVWGTLSCSIFIPPDTQASCSVACEKAVTDLKYGSVCVNIPSVLGYFVGTCTWGGYAGATPQDVQSGIGNIHNTLLYKNVEKSVIRGPWMQIITPFWCHDHANLESLAPWIVKQLAGESLLNWTMCAIHAVQG